MFFSILKKKKVCKFGTKSFQVLGLRKDAFYNSLLHLANLGYNSWTIVTVGDLKNYYILKHGTQLNVFCKDENGPRRITTGGNFLTQRNDSLAVEKWDYSERDLVFNFLSEEKYPHEKKKEWASSHTPHCLTMLNITNGNAMKSNIGNNLLHIFH